MRNFIVRRIKESKKKVKTRFCPEPSGFLHIGHLKNFMINYYLAKKFKGKISIRLDDSNPKKSKKKYSKKIMYEIFMLGFKRNIKYSKTSDYLKRINNILKRFIKKKKAYLDKPSKKGFINAFTFNLGTVFKKRSIKECMYIFKKMNCGKFKEGEFVVRLNTRVESGNLNMRDPIICRIIKGISNDNFVFPTYDVCNSLIDRIEKITFSICTNEFINNKQLFSWLISNYNNEFKKRNILTEQIEFAKLSIEKEELSKRKIKKEILKGNFKGWNDPRLYTISGMINRGYSKNSIKQIALETGYTRTPCLIKKSFMKRILIKNLSREVVNKIVILTKPVKAIIINNIKKNEKEIFLEKKGKIRVCYIVLNGKIKCSLFFLKRKNSIIYVLNLKYIIKKYQIDNHLKKKKAVNTVLETFNSKNIKKYNCLSFKSKEVDFYRKKFKVFKIGYFFISKKKDYFFAREIIRF
ncbi:glutamate--tRNA ligase family protein [Candidatus Vidania fulgoroideorum]